MDNGTSRPVVLPAPSPRALVLLSGGLDSTACVHFYVSHGFEVHALFLDYGQSAATQEARAAANIAKHYDVPLALLACTGPRPKTAGLILGRNAFLVFAALMEFSSSSGLIALGIHSGTAYFDCSEPFLELVQGIVNAYADGRIRVSAPFLSWHKSHIWDYCLASDVPISLTYSCELGQQQPCGECMSCEDLRVLYARAQLNH